MEVYSKTDIGLVRKENQDSCNFSFVSQSCVWAVVCDGMGGANGGKVASQTAVDTISGEIEKLFYEEMTTDEIADVLANAVNAANTEIYKRSIENVELTGMGTTCEAVMVRKDRIFIIHVGDSRVYSIRGGKIKQLTEDHSVVQEMVKRGEITPQQAQNHPNKNFITRALGVSRTVRLDYVEADFLYGDVIVICSDGLSNCVSNADMVKLVHEHRGPEMVELLVEKAKDGGGTDNITVTVIY